MAVEAQKLHKDATHILQWLQPQSSSSLCAYLAGLIDGDGSITIVRRDRAQRKSFSFAPHVMIGGEPKHLTKLRSLVGNLGSVWTKKQPGKRHLAQWQIAGQQARALLFIIQQHLYLKRQQAVVALSMPQCKSRWDATPQLRSDQYRCWVRIKKLNTGGRGKEVLSGI